MIKINQLKVPIQSITRLECKLIEILSISCFFKNILDIFVVFKLKVYAKIPGLSMHKNIQMKIYLKNELHFIKSFFTENIFLVLINLEHVSK